MSSEDAWLQFSMYFSARTRKTPGEKKKSEKRDDKKSEANLASRKQQT